MVFYDLIRYKSKGFSVTEYQEEIFFSTCTEQELISADTEGKRGLADQ